MKPKIKPPKGYRIFTPTPTNRARRADIFYLPWVGWLRSRMGFAYAAGMLYARRIRAGNKKFAKSR